MEITKKLGKNFSSRARYGHRGGPIGVTIHHWGSDGQDFDQVVFWLQGANGANKNSSAHYVLSSGQVVQVVEDRYAAWHAGTNSGNGEDIGIECRPEMSDGDWQTLVELVAYLEQKHNRKLRIRGHSAWKPTKCPGRYSARLDELRKAVDKLQTESPESPPQKPSKAPPWPFKSNEYIGPEGWSVRSISGYHGGREHIRRWQEQMKHRGWAEMIVDGLYGLYGQLIPTASITGKIAVQFQNEKGLAVDGLIGPVTWRAAWELPVT